MEESRPLSQGLSQPSVPVGQECPVLTEALGQPRCLRPVTTQQGCGLLRAAFPSRAGLPPPLEPGGQDDEASGWHSGMGALPGLGGCREGGGLSAETPAEVRGRGFCPLPVLVVGEAEVSLEAPNPTTALEPEDSQQGRVKLSAASQAESVRCTRPKSGCDGYHGERGLGS